MMYVQNTSSTHPAVTAPPMGPDFPIVIVGSGFAGIGMAIQLKKAGIYSFMIFERAGEIGGTWRDNTYPGAACDVPSHVYSYSFEPNAQWKRRYAESQEIQAYLLHCVEKYQLRPHLRLNTAITEARFDAAAGLWTLTTSTGEHVTARVIVSGVGGLVNPIPPDIKGLDTFAGELFHTGRWNHDYDLAGKRVAVIGTGASAIQVVPAIAPKVGTLRIFQRSPAWVVPKRDRAIAERIKRRFERFPFAMRIVRTLLYGFSELMGPIIFLNAPRLSKIGERMSERHLQASVADPALRAKLRPDFQFGCKRMLISDDYWSTMERDNVELVTDAITEIRPGSIVTADGREHAVDAIVLATGFSVSITTPPFPVTGLDEVTLESAWRNGAEAYKGVSVAGIPNYFIMMGPNTGPGHTSVLVFTEAQITYILQVVQTMIGGAIKHVSIKQEVQDRYNAGLQARMKHMVWSTGCTSWYLGNDGANHALFPGLATEYCARMRTFKPAEYNIVPS